MASAYLPFYTALRSDLHLFSYGQKVEESQFCVERGGTGRRKGFKISCLLSLDALAQSNNLEKFAQKQV
jgi:hypothetical protein